MQQTSESKERAKQNAARAGTLKLVGGRLCLDFCNTADWHLRERPVEILLSYADLLAWGRHVDLLSAGDVGRLKRLVDEYPAGADKILRRAIGLREAVFRIFSAAALGRDPDGKDLSLLNRRLARAMAHTKITRKGQKYVWDFQADPESLDAWLYPVVRSAARLLISDDLKKVKLCVDEECGWLFLDTSRNQRRRWCDMQDCGNRAKAKRFYQRKKGLK